MFFTESLREENVHRLSTSTPLEYNVMGADTTRRHKNDSFKVFNPTNTAPPFTQVPDPTSVSSSPPATVAVFLVVIAGSVIPAC